MSELRIKTAQIFEPLLERARYKGAWGGRGSGKSHFFAEDMVDYAATKNGFRGVCIREIQKNLDQSAKQLIVDKIHKHGLESHGFKVFKQVIETPGDGLIMFNGMQDHTAESIKSLENIDVAWVEEAQTLSATSLRLLRPTIRADDSELWFSWNPRRKADPVDMMLRQGTPPTGSIIVKANWDGNPWFPDVLEQERQDCLRDQPEEYEHIWEGGYATITDGAYFAQHLATARAEDRIGRVGPDPLMSYRAFVDIGGTGAKADSFVIIIAQFIGREIRVLDYYEVQGQPLGHHLAWLEEHGYTPKNTHIWLPHDGATHDKVHSVSYESALSQVGFKVTVVPNQGKGAAKKRIEEARRLFPVMWFDKDKTEPLLEALGWYHEKKDDIRNIGLGPEHDWASHGADAFGLMAIVYKAPKQRQPAPKPKINIT